MRFETILAIIKSTESDYLRAARLFDAFNTPAFGPQAASPVAGKARRKARGPNKPKVPQAGSVGHLNGNHETAGE